MAPSQAQRRSQSSQLPTESSLKKNQATTTQILVSAKASRPKPKPSEAEAEATAAKEEEDKWDTKMVTSKCQSMWQPQWPTTGLLTISHKESSTLMTYMLTKKEPSRPATTLTKYLRRWHTWTQSQVCKRTQRLSTKSEAKEAEAKATASQRPLTTTNSKTISSWWRKSTEKVAWWATLRIRSTTWCTETDTWYSLNFILITPFYYSLTAAGELKFSDGDDGDGGVELL